MSEREFTAFFVFFWEFTALGAQRCPAQARPQTKEGFPEEAVSEDHWKGNCSQLFWLSFPPSTSWCLQEHTVHWVPSLQGGLTNRLLVPLGNGRQCFLLDTASSEDSMATSHSGNSHRASWYLERPVDISIFTSDFPWAPFILLFGDTRAWTISGGHRCAGWVSLQGEMQGPSLKEKESTGSSRNRAPTLGMLWWGSGRDFLLHMDLPLRQSGCMNHFLEIYKKEEEKPFLSSSFRDLYLLNLFCYVCCLCLLCCKQKMTEPHAYLLNKELSNELKLIVNMKIKLEKWLILGLGQEMT